MSQQSITLLGSFQVQRDGVAVTRFHGDKVRALLAYLAVESDRPHARAALVGLFWPEQPDDQALRNLTQALVRLRAALRAGDDPLHATRQAVQWGTEAADEESLSLRRELGDKLGVAYSLSSLGLVSTRQGDYAAVRAYHEESLSLRRDLGSKWGIADSLRNLGHVAEGEYALAAELLQEGLALFRELGAKKDAVECLENLAAAGGAQGQATRAARLYGAAEALREVFEFPRPPLFRIDYERSVAALHRQLAEPMFTTTWYGGARDGTGAGYRLRVVQ